MRDPNIQQKIRDYHGLMESAIGSDHFVTGLDGYFAFINDYEEAVSKWGTNEEDYKLLTGSIELDYFIGNINE